MSQLTPTARLQQFANGQRVRLEWVKSLDQTTGIDVHTVFPKRCFDPHYRLTYAVVDGQEYSQHTATSTQLQEAKHQAAELLIQSGLLMRETLADKRGAWLSQARSREPSQRMHLVRCMRSIYLHPLA
ncbi:hypothetical protein B0J17DRAFT_709483 [Rhizoctonia solani]|nr:hypothetical protein B0J17DRAFT_709483 [Rhizoctonia solani]